MQLDLVLRGSQQHLCAVRESHVRCRRVRCRRREKNSAPARRRRFHVLHVQNQVREALVEYARLDCEWRLRRKHLIFQAAQRANRSRAQPERQYQRRKPAAQRNESNWHQQTPQADAARMQRHNFAVRGKSAEADQHSDQHGHRNRERQHRRQRAQKNQQHCADAAGVAHHDVHQTDQLRNEKYECEYREAQRGVGGDFATDIFIEQAHVRGLRF